MFDFTPVGVVVAGAGVTFILLVGWRLVPTRTQAGTGGFEIGAYITEARVEKKAKAVGMTLRELETALDEVGAQIVGLVRDEVRLPAPHPRRKVRAGDILIIEAEPEALAAALSQLGLRLEEDVRKEEGDQADAKPGTSGSEESEETGRSAIESDEIVLLEVAVLPDSAMAGYSATDIDLRSRFGINLLAVSRQGKRTLTRLRRMPIQEGDVLLLQGAPDTLADFAAEFGCVPLAERALRLPSKGKAFLAGATLVGAVVVAASGLLSAAVAFAVGVVAAMLLNVVPPRTAYQGVDWPVVVLLGALIPVAGAMESTGTASLLASTILDYFAQDSPVLGLILILVLTMLLYAVVNNAATAAVMCPIAIGSADQLGVSADPLLMAVAVGASCAFVTPIAHQNNTLILGPAGFHFGDYWQLGLPIQILAAAVAIPMIQFVWPF
jgi:di/tricarboxylate transporter